MSNQDKLFEAVENKRYDIVEKILAKAENQEFVNATNKDGETPLHVAAESGHLDVVKFLIENGAGINVKDKDGETPLHCAVENGNLNIVKFLIERGAGVNVADNVFRITPLHLAVWGGYLNVVKFLIEKGADINVKVKDGKTPLQLAVENGQWRQLKEAIMCKISL